MRGAVCSPQPPLLDTTALALAVCHELGNDLAALRLAAHRLQERPPDLDAQIRQLGALSEQWLAQLRRLLRPPEEATHVGPHTLQRSLRHALEQGAGITVEVTPGLPAVRTALNVLIEQLVFLFHTIIQDAHTCCLGVTTLTSELRLVLTLETSNQELCGPPLKQPARGPRLAVQTSRAILSRHGAGLTRAESGDQLVVHLPVEDL